MKFLNWLVYQWAALTAAITTIAVALYTLDYVQFTLNGSFLMVSW